VELLAPPQLGGGPLLLHDPSHGAGEFFLLEYRTNAVMGGWLSEPGSYDHDVASPGLAIWHIIQDPGTKAPVAVPLEVDRTRQVAGVFYRGAPGWQQGEGHLRLRSDGVVRLRWMDGSDTEVQLLVNGTTSDGKLLSVTWCKIKYLAQ
jgi:hypothetical protein